MPCYPVGPHASQAGLGDGTTPCAHRRAEAPQVSEGRRAGDARSEVQGDLALLHGVLTVPRAEREFHNLLALRSLGIPAVEPLACGHSGRWILYHRSFLITREFMGAVNLKTWMKAVLKGKPHAFSRDEIRTALPETPLQGP